MNKLIIAALAITTAFTACKKGTISTKRLDGTWTLKSGTYTTKSTSTNSGYSATYNYNGSAFISSNYVTTNSGTSVTKSDTLLRTITIKFSKSDNSFERTTVSTSMSTNFGGFYYSDANYTNSQSYNVKYKQVSTMTEKGTYTISGAGGDIEANTQLVLFPKSGTGSSTNTFAGYVNGSTGAAASGFISNPNGGGLVLMSTVTPATTTSSYTSTTSATDSGEIWEVVEMDKTTLQLKSSSVNSSTSTSGSFTSTNTNEDTYDITFNK